MFLTLCWSLQDFQFVVLGLNYNYSAVHFVKMFRILSGTIDLITVSPTRMAAAEGKAAACMAAADGKAADDKATPPQPDSRQLIITNRSLIVANRSLIAANKPIIARNRK